MRLLIVSTLLLVGCSSKSELPSKNYFVGIKGCFLLYNLKTQQFEQEIGGEECKIQRPACSTFKVPLAVMAFDAGILKDEKQTYKWDGIKRMLPVWNQDHNAQSWMKESVVWFSQVITPKLGAKRLQRYLDEMNYGNKDMSGGLTQAWLNSPNDETALKISPYEQVEFMKKLWTGTLPASAHAQELTRKITYLETSPQGFGLSGKTGSNFYNKERTIQFGWFISHLQNNEQEYIAVTTISDLAPIKTTSFGGPRAKELTKTILSDLQLW